MDVHLKSPLPVPVSGPVTATELREDPIPVTISGRGVANDGFGRLRVSPPETIFDSKQLFNSQVHVWNDVALSGTGTATAHSIPRASTTISVSDSTAGVRVRQTRRRHPYQPGKSQLFMGTFVGGSTPAGITKRIGLFDDENGIFLENAAGVIAFRIRSFVTGAAIDTGAVQSAWTGDKLDGTGASGKTLDFSKAHIVWIDFEWLGTGTVRCGFVIDGEYILCNVFHHANTLTSVYMSTPNLPVRYEIRNDGTGPAASLECICTTVIAEGGYRFTGLDFSIDRGVTGFVTLANTSLYPVIAVRIPTSRIGAVISIVSVSIVCSTTALFRYALILNPTVAGTALSFAAVGGNSIIQADVDTTNATTVSGGSVIKSGYAQQSTEGEVSIELPNPVELGHTVAGTPDVLVLAIAVPAGSVETFFAAINYREQL